MSEGDRARLERHGRAQGQGRSGSPEQRAAVRSGIDGRRAAAHIAPLPKREKTENEFYLRARRLGLR